MNKLKQIILSGLVLFAATFTVAPLATVYAAEPIDEACAAIDCDKPTGLKLNEVIKTIIEILAFVIAVVAVIMIMISGFKYVTASGDSTKVASAKNTLVYAVIGLFIAAVAQVIVKYVIGTTT